MERLDPRAVSVTRRHDGGWLVAAVVNGVRQQRTYLGDYTKTQARMEFLREFQPPAHRGANPNPRRKPEGFPLGSISEGTLRTPDLVAAFASTLETVASNREVRRLLNDVNHWLDREEGEEGRDDLTWAEEGEELLDELTGHLEAAAPPYVRFGTSEGDGASFGFWPDMAALEEAVHFREEGIIRVTDLGEVPRGFSGLVMQVSDHGNVTLYTASRGKLRELWSIV